MVLNSYPELFSESVSCTYKGDKSPDLGHNAASKDFDQNHLENRRSFRIKRRIFQLKASAPVLATEAAFSTPFAVCRYDVGAYVSKLTY